MKFTICAMFVVAVVCVSNAQLAPGVGGIGGPPASPGWLIGQGASINAVSLAVNGALAANSDGSTLPPELQVCNKTTTFFESNCNVCFVFRCIFQEELQTVLDDAATALGACDDLLLTSTVWRYKICKFQELSKIKARLLELKLKAAAAAAASVPTEPEQSTSQAV